MNTTKALPRDMPKALPKIWERVIFWKLNPGAPGGCEPAPADIVSYGPAQSLNLNVHQPGELMPSSATPYSNPPRTGCWSFMSDVSLPMPLERVVYFRRNPGAAGGIEPAPADTLSCGVGETRDLNVHDVGRLVLASRVPYSKTPQAGHWCHPRDLDAA